MDSQKVIDEARSALSAGQFDTALAILESALSAEPNNIAVVMQKVHVLRKMGDRAGKLNALRDAAKLAPNDIDVLLNYAEAASEEMESEALAALNSIRHQLGSDADRAHWLWQRLVQLEISKYRSEHHLDPALAASWDDAHGAPLTSAFKAWRATDASLLFQADGYDGYVALGAMYAEIGQDKEAEDCFRRAALIKPGTICDIAQFGSDFFEDLEKKIGSGSFWPLFATRFPTGTHDYR